MTGVLVLGALHHDVVVDAERLPRLDETLIGTGVDYRLGGKGGNQAIAAARMGASVAMLGRVGRDEAGRSILSTLDRAGVDRKGVLETDAPTGMSVAITDRAGGYGAVVVSGANLGNDGRMLDTDATVALIQNEIPAEANRTFAHALPDNTRLIWNAAPARDWDETVAARTDLLVVNRIEAEDLTGTPDADASARKLAGRVRGQVIVTLGEEGAILSDGASSQHLPAVPAQVVSTHGAGDMFCGALAAAMARGEDLDAAIAFAQTAASLFVAAPIARRESVTRETVEAAQWP